MSLFPLAAVPSLPLAFLDGAWLRDLINSCANMAEPGTFFAYSFNIRATLALILVSLCCGMVGSLVVGSRMAFFSDALAHCAFAGVSIGFLLFNGIIDRLVPGADFWQWVTPIMVAFGMLVGYGIASVRQRTGLTGDTVIGVFFASAIGLAAMLRQLIRSRRLFNLEDFLFGDPLNVLAPDLIYLTLVTLITVAVLLWIYNDLLLAGFNPSLALSRRVPVRRVNYLFVVLLALIVNVCLRAVGVLLINALMIVPAATAIILSRNLRQLFWLTIALTLATSLGGQFLSWEVSARADVKLGIPGTIVLLNVVLFVASMAVQQTVGRWGGRREEARLAKAQANPSLGSMRKGMVGSYTGRATRGAGARRRPSSSPGASDVANDIDYFTKVPDFILIFTGILYEAMPFIVLGALIAGILEELLPQRLIAKIMPRSRLLAILIGGLLGLLFPMCECGIIPVMRRLLRKGLPLSCCVAYLLAGPIINVVVILSTFAAFSGMETMSGGGKGGYQMGGLWMTGLRMGLGYLVAVGTSLIVEWQHRKHGDALLTPLTRPTNQPLDEDEEKVKTRKSVWQRLSAISETALHDFIDITAFLILGALLAAFTRMYLTHETIDKLSKQYPGMSILIMMGLAVLLCLCSEADAFVAASFQTLRPAAKLAFLTLGPMLDLKLYMMYTRVFRTRLIWTIFLSVIVQVFVYSYIVHFLWETYAPLLLGPPASAG